MAIKSQMVMAARSCLRDLPLKMPTTAVCLWSQKANEVDPDEDWTKDESGDEAESRETF
jgi:hypothetical protein